MATLFVARHGQTDWNLERRWQGHADPPLNATGRAQSVALAASLADRVIEAVYSSDLARARETAEIVAGALNLPVELDPRLREVDVGEWSGLTTDEVLERYPEGYARRRAGGTGWTRGESNDAMAARVLEGLLAVAARRPSGRVLVVTHGGPMVRTWLACAEDSRGDWQHPANCDMDEIAVLDGRMRWIDSTRGGLHQQVQG